MAAKDKETESGDYPDFCRGQDEWEFLDAFLTTEIDKLSGDIFEFGLSFNSDGLYTGFRHKKLETDIKALCLNFVEQYARCKWKK